MAEVGAESVQAPALAPLSAWTVLLLVAATFGAAMALIAPMAFSLSLRVDQLVPGDRASIGYIIGIGSLATLITAPLTGIFSDRTRSRWGRRRPFTVLGTVVGLAAVPLMAFAPNIPLLTVGWVLSSFGWGTAVGSIGNYQADRLPPGQRGKVAGLTGLMMQVAPVLGVLLAGLVTHDPLLVFLLPTVVGAPLVVLFVVFAREQDSRDFTRSEQLSLLKIIQSFGFNPREHPDFAWTWLGRFIFFLGLSLTTTYTAFFYASRLGISVGGVAPVIAVVSLLSILTATVGAIGGGALSDRLRRRRPFILVGVLVTASGATISAFAPSLSLLLTGALVSSLGLSLFLAVNQAMVLDVLPHRDTQAGRFMAITSFSQKIPSAIAPLAAPLILALGTSSGENYTALYLIAGALAIAGGIVICTRVKGVR